MFLQQVLTSSGHEVAQAQDGEEGLRQLFHAPAELVIIDLYMPGKEGMETISDLRKRFPTLPIIAMSGMSLANEMLSVARLLGVKTTLKKPFSTEELLKAVDNALGG